MTPRTARRPRGARLRLKSASAAPDDPLAAAGVLGLGLLGEGVDPGLEALLGGDRRRGSGQRVEAAAGLGERDHVADGVAARQQGDDAVPAEGDAAVRRRPEGERVEQEAELLLLLLLAETHEGEHALLDVAAVAQVAKEEGLALLMDATFASPVNFRPLEHGADVVNFSRRGHQYDSVQVCG